jgi:hypothetical protein
MTSTGDITGTSIAARTDAGMLALWNPARFSAIADYQAWENALLEDNDIAQHIHAGELVPINIGSDGAFGFLIRTGPSGTLTLTSREEHYLVASSQPYLYLSGGIACLSGIEDISAAPGPAVATLPVPAGRCAVTIHLIQWDAEPGAKDQHGRPAPGALPDFIVLISSQPAEGTSYRGELQTFDRPGA